MKRDTRAWWGWVFIGIGLFPWGLGLVLWYWRRVLRLFLVDLFPAN